MLASVPEFPYKTALSVKPTAPEGMGRVAALPVGGRRGADIYLLSDSRAVPLPIDDDVRLRVHISKGLGRTQLREDAAAWEPVLSSTESWQFAFWVSFEYENITPTVFIEERTGDHALDMQILRIVERLDLWDDPSGTGIVSLVYRPEAGDNNAD